MALKLPDLSAASCRLFVACGQLVDPSPATKAILDRMKRKKRWLVAKVRERGNTAYLRAGFGGKDGKHCHVDLATREVFPPKLAPKPNTTREAIEKVLDGLRDEKIVVDLDGLFSLKGEDLPAAVQATSYLFNTAAGNVGIKMTGGMLAVSGAPIHTIKWEIQKSEPARAVVELEAKMAGTVEEDYLFTMFEVLKSGFESFVMSGVPRAQGNVHRLAVLEHELATIKQHCQELRDGSSINVPVQTLAPEPYTLKRPLQVVVRPVDGEFLATFFDANIAMTGDTEEEAVANLKALIIDSFEHLEENESNLGPWPVKQLAILREVLQKQAS